MGELFFANLVGSIRRRYIRGPKKLRSTCSGNIRPTGRSLPLIGWEQSSPVDEEKKKKEWMTVSLGSSLASGGIYLSTCGRRSLVSETQHEIIVRWSTLWGMIKVYWLEPTFSIMLSAARLPQVRAEACISFQASWEWSKVWTVRTLFGELKVQFKRNES